MGLLEDIDALELSDDVKAKLKGDYQAQIDSERNNTKEERRKNRRTAVEDEISELSKMFSDDEGKVDPQAIGLLKYTRRVLLSDDEEPGLVLLSDDELELSDDERTGSRQREEVTAAGVVREFINLIPKSEEGKISLSDIVSENSNNDRPEHGNKPTTEDENKAASGRLGFSGTRTRKRYTRGAVHGGGE